jgi:quercetin dioxygenase-like cupin family protein
MLVVQPDRAELLEVWSDGDPTRGLRFGFAVSALNGAAGSAVAYAEVDAGKHKGIHWHSAEETHFVLAGSAEIVIGDDRQRLSEGSVAVVPANAPHDVYNVSSETVRMITFFPSAAVVTTADQSVEPGGRRVFVTAAEE